MEIPHDLAMRIYDYFTRIREKHHMPITAIVILAIPSLLQS